MSLLKSTAVVVTAASVMFVSGMSAEAQNRTTHRTNTNQGINGGMGTTPMQSSINSAQNSARVIAAQQHQIWLAHRMKKNAEEKVKKAKAAEEKAAAKAAAEANKTSSTDDTATKTTSTTTAKATTTTKTTTPVAKTTSSK